MNLFAKSLIAIILILIIIQFIPVDRSNPPVEADVPASLQVHNILRRACYDCHSNETVWPWYGKVAPVSWLLAKDVREGRAELNFSTWNQYSGKKQVHKLKEVIKEIEEAEMPPFSYVALHNNARIETSDIAALRSWVAEMTGLQPRPAQD
jgi:hypothetical protein